MYHSFSIQAAAISWQNFFESGMLYTFIQQRLKLVDIFFVNHLQVSR